LGTGTIDMMRVLLINPFYPVSETPSPPLGLAFLAAAMLADGIKVQILDLVVYPYTKERLAETLETFDPQIVGATAVTMNFNHAADVMKDVKVINPGILTVMGGPHVTFCAPETLQSHPEIDFIVLGEGEETLVELVRAYGNGHSWSGIKGLAYRENGKPVLTPARDPIKNIDALPEPARHLIPLGRYRALGLPISMTTSRGCPFQCIFCVGRKMVGARVRYRNPNKIVDELAYLSTLDFRQINVADDLFTASKKHCIAVCDEILRRKLKIRWTSFARVDTVSRPVLERMKQAGCTAVSFGVESGSPEILKTIKKGITLDQVIDAVSMCNQVGVTPQASFILGLPGETPQTLQQTVAFAERLKAMGVLHGYHLLAPFPGTDVREQIRAYDIQIMSNDWNDYHANQAIVRTSAVDQKTLDDIVKNWQSHFDAWLGDIKRRRDSGKATEEEAWPLTNLEHIVLIYDMMMKEVLEEIGWIPFDRTDALSKNSLACLADRVDGTIPHPLEQIRKTLHLAAEKGYLTQDRKGATYRWRWKDYL
jgi:anaerobic magnesium-protoporphyrin IX monomethyl ester cyclase